MQDGRILTRQVTVESVKDGVIHLLIRIADDRGQTLSLENHQLKVFEISEIRSCLEQHQFQVVHGGHQLKSFESDRVVIVCHQLHEYK